MKKDTKIGFIITYFHNSEEGFNLLKKNLKVLSREDYYLVLATHSPLQGELQDMVDFYFYQSMNIVDDRKYSHGVAESNLIEISLKHLRQQGIDWTYKVSYDIEINDVYEFKKWDKREYQFVSCNWGPNVICTNSFFSNIDFLLENITFYQSVEEMFAINNILENCWEFDIMSKNLLSKVFSFKDKQDFYGPNKIDVLFYDYSEIEFWYSPEESKFYIKSSNDIENVHLRIFDYYTDICIYIDKNFKLIKDIIFWILPPFEHNLKSSVNGFYLEVYLPGRTVRKNILIKDFNLKHKLSNKFKLIKDKEIKFNEYSDFNNLNIYNDFGVDINQIRNFLDVGSCYGMAAVPFITNEVKTYLIEADVNNVEILRSMFDKNSKIKIIDKAIAKNDGTMDFYVTSGIGSLVSSIYEVDANGNIGDRKKITVESITPNNLLENFVDEDYVDLMKVDIEGSEYDFFETISDENLRKVKRIIIEFHNNENFKVMNILKKLTVNNFRFKLSKWSNDCGDYIIENKMGVIYAESI